MNLRAGVFGILAIALGAIGVSSPLGWLTNGSASGALCPAPRLSLQPDPAWLKRHEDFVKIARVSDADVLFLGDSITDRWRASGLDTWERYLAPFKAVNFGIDGDRVEHVLWRLKSGELAGFSPRVVVLMIGTNNLEDNTTAEIAGGVRTIVRYIHTRLPRAKILLQGILPRGAAAHSAIRAKIGVINEELRRLDDGGIGVRFVDFGRWFRQQDGTISPATMPDFLHLSRRGYEIWAEALRPILAEMVARRSA